MPRGSQATYSVQDDNNNITQRNNKVTSGKYFPLPTPAALKKSTADLAAGVAGTSSKMSADLGSYLEKTLPDIKVVGRASLAAISKAGAEFGIGIVGDYVSYKLGFTSSFSLLDSGIDSAVLGIAIALVVAGLVFVKIVVAFSSFFSITTALRLLAFS